MSIPRDHHYLPKFYLNRWAQEGEVVRYVRPCGHGGSLHCTFKPTSAVGYEPNLYQLPDIYDPAQSQSLESVLFQRIDDKAAVSLEKFDQLQIPTEEDHKALCQFAISLLYRTPKRLEALRAKLATQTDGAPYAGLSGQEYDNKLKATTNRLLAMLVESESALSIFSKFKAGRIVISGASKKFLTSDRPMTVSSQLTANDSFFLLPYAPDRLLIFTRHKSIAESFASQNQNKLVAGVNQAVVEQSESIVIASDKNATRMIDRLFLRLPPQCVADPAGLIRRRSPLMS